MSFANKLGGSYEQAKDKVKLRKIVIETDDAKFELRVRIPLKKEMEALMVKIATPEPERIEALFDFFTKSVKESVAEGGDDFIEKLNAEKTVLAITDDDVIFDGVSARQAAIMAAMYQVKVEEYFHLLQSEIGDPIDESFEQISDEFPELVIKFIIDEIEKAIKPDYKTAKKN